MGSRSLVTAIVPNWNHAELLESALASLRSQSRPPDEIIVVDNGSTDRSSVVAREAGARLICLGQNRGFAAAVNIGIQQSRGSILAVLNNDVELEPSWLEQLLDSLGDPACWFATGKLLRRHNPHELDGVYDALARSGCAWRCGEGRLDGPSWQGKIRIFFPPMTAVVLRKTLFERVGLLDERFGSYMEDVEFGLRCALAGCQGEFVPEAIAFHVGSSTFGRWHPEVVRLLARNQVLIVGKHFPRALLWRYAWPILVGQLLWGLVALRHGRLWAYLRGKLDGVRAIPSVRHPRAEPQQLAKVLRESEELIHKLQRATGFDLYWRLYFALT